MNNFYTVNNHVAIRPLVNEGVKTTIINGVAMVSMGSDVMVAEVIFDSMINNEIILKGSKIMINGDSATKPWNHRRFKYKDDFFVLVPYSEILMISPPEEK